MKSLFLKIYNPALKFLILVMIGCMAYMAVSFFSSCSKQAIDPPAVSKIEFKIGGVQKQYVQVSASSTVSSGHKVFSFLATKEPTTDNLFNLSIMTPDLLPGTYNLATGVVLWHDGSTGGTNVSTGFTVTIASNVNGLVNGSFAGSLQTWSGANLPVVQGIIQNIQVN